jgi:hypothetical protein
MIDIKTIYTQLYNNFHNNSFFDFSSSVYLQEFFMYLAIKSDNNIKILCIPLLDVQNIFSKLVHENINLLTDINNFLLKYNTTVNFENIKYFYTEQQIDLGQQNFIMFMNEIFNHKYVSDLIKKIKINLKICGNNVNIEMYNNDNIRDVKDEICLQLKINYNIFINPNRILLMHKKLVLSDTNTLDFYNIQNNTVLNSSIIMSSAPMI